jgi:Zn-dependent protease
LDAVDILLLAVAIPSVILHEVSHGWAALRFGDDTAKRKGRLTLNPIAHIDPVGTILLPAVLAFSGLGVIGYAKPVPVNVSRLRKPRDHAVLVSLAGPATNLVLVVASIVLLRALGTDELRRNGLDLDLPSGLYLLGLTNLLLAGFNLLPIPPLDGSAVVERLLPTAWLPRYYRLRRFAIVLPIILVVVVNTTDGSFIEPVLDLWDDLAL